MMGKRTTSGLSASCPGIGERSDAVLANGYARSAESRVSTDFLSSRMQSEQSVDARIRGHDDGKGRACMIARTSHRGGRSSYAARRIARVRAFPVQLLRGH